MKNLFVRNIKESAVGSTVELFAWIKGIRAGKAYTFLDVCDSTGEVQVIVDNARAPEGLTLEQSVRIVGKITPNQHTDTNEITADTLEILGDVTAKLLRPNPRSDFDLFDNKYVNFVQENRHLFIRNPKAMAALRARDLVKRAVHAWFAKNGFTEITAPILTPVLLYTEDTGIHVNVNDQDIFLTQCVAFYLESAVHAFEKVYNIGPSFRGAESVSPRHLTEYWHVKAELAFCSFEEIFGVVEDMIAFIAEQVAPQSEEICHALGLEPTFAETKKAPFPRITYRDAIQLCRNKNIDVQFGKSLNGEAEAFLTEYFNAPVWVTHNVRSIEGFPYKICEFDEELTYTADLIAPAGGGEILGVADKITDYDELTLRLAEKGKENNPGYEWFRELRNYGTVPHCGIGMGLERLIKWLYRLPHVREAIPFPRSMGRKIYP